MNTTALDDRILTCSAGAYPWDDWERSALASGLAPALAALGRSVMREAGNHAWCGRLKKECGWSDEGRAMLARVTAVAAPHGGAVAMAAGDGWVAF